KLHATMRIACNLRTPVLALIGYLSLIRVYAKKLAVLKIAVLHHLHGRPVIRQRTSGYFDKNSFDIIKARQGGFYSRYEKATAILLMSTHDLHVEVQYLGDCGQITNIIISIALIAAIWCWNVT